MATTEKDPKPSDRLPEDTPDAVRDAADGDLTAETDPNGKAEKTALDWILGATMRPGRYVPVELETPEGMQKLVFRILALDPNKIIELENEHRKGDGPFAELNELSFNAALVTEATEFITDSSGRQIIPDSPEFRGDRPNAALAMERRFAFQGGLLDGIVARIRQISGYDAQRVGGAERSLVEAGLG